LEKGEVEGNSREKIENSRRGARESARKSRAAERIRRGEKRDWVLRVENSSHAAMIVTQRVRRNAVKEKNSLSGTQRMISGRMLKDKNSGGEATKQSALSQRQRSRRGENPCLGALAVILEGPMPRGRKVREKA